MKPIAIPLVVLSTLMAWGCAFAADAAAGKADVAAGKELNSKLCAACHGEQGKSKNEIWPHLAGQRETYVLKQLRDFKEGTRPDPVMAPIASMLSEQDMRNLAAYYKSLTP